MASQCRTRPAIEQSNGIPGFRAITYWFEILQYGISQKSADSPRSFLTWGQPQSELICKRKNRSAIPLLIEISSEGPYGKERGSRPILPFHNIKLRKTLAIPLFHEAVHENAKDFAFQKLRRDPFNIRGNIKPKTTKHAGEQRPQRQSLCPIGLKAHARIV